MIAESTGHDVNEKALFDLRWDETYRRHKKDSTVCAKYGLPSSQCDGSPFFE
ncbi:MAG: hypothetical protein NPIRA01_18640 [Nitrospirales bacterium]|nr:MAG: hypothetical protein NPIRA01_18640 [Nitrospirales bacterium]